MIKCISLLSGGLDSILSTRLMLEQGIDTEALTLNNDFHPRPTGAHDDTPPRRAALQLGVPLHEIYEPELFLEMLRNPVYGYGKNINPCIDCRMLLLRLAKKRMEETGANFVVTGEVIGERPMSQRRDAMEMIEKRSGLVGYILRPLSAQLLEPTVPENEGWVDRSQLLAIQGRSRKPQMALAEKFGITEYPSPAGGCLLTDPGFAVRMRDLMKHDTSFDSNDVTLLKYGRHFRLPSGARVVVGRDHDENIAISALARPDDVLLLAADFPGPITLVRGGMEEDTLLTAAALTAKYGKGRAESTVSVTCRKPDETILATLDVAPAPAEMIETLRVC